MVEMSWKDKNLGVVAVCDLWTRNRERAAGDCKARFNAQVKQFKYLEEMLRMPELDGIMIATGDHQHAKLLAQVVNAGKDCYVEKPMAQDIEEAKLARAAVLRSKQIVQNGSQWLSDPYQLKVREIISRSGTTTTTAGTTRMIRTWRPFVKLIPTGTGGFSGNPTGRSIHGLTLNFESSVTSREA
jgi:predicted dehydrogenase